MPHIILGEDTWGKAVPRKIIWPSIVALIVLYFALSDLLDTEAASEDEIDEDEAEDDEDAEEAKSTPSKDSKKKKFHALMGKNAYCVCMVASKPKRDANEVADEPMSDQELSDQLNEKLEVLDASSKSKKAAIAAYKKKLHNLIKRYFGQRNLYCYCTKNKMVLK